MSLTNISTNINNRRRWKKNKIQSKKESHLGLGIRKITKNMGMNMGRTY